MNRKIILTLIGVFLVSLILSGCSSAPATTPQQPKTEVKQQRQILLSSTIGPIDSGIVAVLEDNFQKKSGIVVRHVGAGTGATLQLAKSGSFDLVMVHAKALEEQFVSDGFGVKRYDLMYNDFVLVGPPEDPAKIRGEKNISQALKKIMDSQSLFITRGDKSGTHVKEMELWNAAGIKPSGSWYKTYEKGSEGNSKTLSYTNEQKAYTIMDRATYIIMKNELKLQVLVEKDESMLNYITLIPVNPAKFPNVKAKEAMEFIDWLTSEEGQKIIRDFGKDKYGEPLFFPNSPVGKNLK